MTYTARQFIRRILAENLSDYERWQLVVWFKLQDAEGVASFFEGVNQIMSNPTPRHRQLMRELYVDLGVDLNDPTIVSF